MRTADLHRLARYAISGAASALTHFSVALALAEGLRVWPVVASTLGFVASIAVSYGLQRSWVFRSSTRHGVAGARFLTVTAVAFGLNTGVVWFGTAALHAPYRYVQAVALLAIPIVNYTLNSRWTFRGHRARPGHPAQADVIAEDSSGASSRL